MGPIPNQAHACVCRWVEPNTDWRDDSNSPLTTSAPFPRICRVAPRAGGGMRANVAVRCWSCSCCPGPHRVRLRHRRGSCREFRREGRHARDVAQLKKLAEVGDPRPRLVVDALCAQDLVDAASAFAEAAAGSATDGLAAYVEHARAHPAAPERRTRLRAAQTAWAREMPTEWCPCSRRRTRGRGTGSPCPRSLCAASRFSRPSERYAEPAVASRGRGRSRRRPSAGGSRASQRALPANPEPDGTRRASPTPLVAPRRGAWPSAVPSGRRKALREDRQVGYLQAGLGETEAADAPFAGGPPSRPRRRGTGNTQRRSSGTSRGRRRGKGEFGRHYGILGERSRFARRRPGQAAASSVPHRSRARRDVPSDPSPDRSRVARTSSARRQSASRAALDAAVARSASPGRIRWSSKPTRVSMLGRLGSGYAQPVAALRPATACRGLYAR